MRSDSSCVARTAVPASTNSAPVCPDCGAGMARRYEHEPVYGCTACGTLQRLETLDPRQTARQQGAMHDRGTNRLLEMLRRHCA